MIILSALFAIFAIIGLLLILLDFAAMSAHPTPSQYRYDIAGVGILIFIVCGLISLAAFAGSFI